MKRRIFSIVVMINMLLSAVALGNNDRAQEDTFPLPDKDSDGLANTMETTGWNNLAGGPFVTDPNYTDNNNDGLSDDEEKLFNSLPLDSHNPGLAV